MKPAKVLKCIALLSFQILAINHSFSQYTNEKVRAFNHLDSVYSAYKQDTAYRFTGSDQEFKVPAGVTKLVVKMFGAGGGGQHFSFVCTKNYSCNGELIEIGNVGGTGGFTVAILDVVPGETLTVIVGEGGHVGPNPGAYGGGGANLAAGGCGGGRTAIKRGSTELLTAGGGGGGGRMGLRNPNRDHYYSAGGGAYGNPLSNVDYSDARGGTATKGGIGGNGCCPSPSPSPGGNGSQFLGGAAGLDGPGSGGGGYFGGGGGAVCNEDQPVDPQRGDGGGGSGFVTTNGAIGWTSISSLQVDNDRHYFTDYYNLWKDDSARYSITTESFGGERGEPGQPGLVIIKWMPTIRLLDPYPSMITAQGKLNTDISEIDKDNVVSSAAVDGITKVLIYAEINRPLTFSIPSLKYGSLGTLANPDALQTSITVDPKDGKVVAVYTAPDSYGFDFALKDGRDAAIKVKDQGQELTIPKLILKTPPVVMVHGMWSNPGVWKDGGFESYLMNKGFHKPFYADYSGNNFVTPDPLSHESYPGRIAVERAILEALDAFRSEKTAVTQVDVVAHSLGGLMTRCYFQQVGTVNDLNYFKGPIHKFITLGTPTNGSPWGPLLWDNRDKIIHQRVFIPYVGFRTISISVKDLAAQLGKPIGSCHRDFGQNSTAYQHLNAISSLIKAHAIVGSYRDASKPNVKSGNTLSYDALSAVSQYLTGLWFAQVFDCNGTEMNSDLIVPMVSEESGFDNSNFTVYYNTNHCSLAPGEKSETDYTAIQSSVSTLLTSDFKNLFTTNLPAPTTLPYCIYLQHNAAVAKTSAKATSPNDSMYIKITSPASAASYQQNSGANIHLQLQPNGGLVLSSGVFLINGIGLLMADSITHDATFSLPSNSPAGNITIAAFARDGDGNLYADTVHIVVTPTGTLDSIAADPGYLTLDSSLRQRSMYVTGFFKNGNTTTETNLTNGSTGTTYSAIKGNSVFNVNENGLVTAAAPGVDTLLIKNAGKTIKVPVKVDANFSGAHYFENTIDFAPIPDKKIGDAPFVLEASATSGNPVLFSVASGPATIENGILTITGSGKVSVKASDKGNAYFGAAPDVIKSFNVTSTTQVVSGFTLIDAEKDKDIIEIKDSNALDLSLLPHKGLNIQANTIPARVGSVVFELSGQQKRYHVENGPPYALFKNINGNYFGGSLQAGAYTLTATPYSKAKGKGTAGTPLTIHFKITYPAAVSSFTLVNAANNKDILELKNGDVLDLSTLPSQKISIRANTTPDTVGSVLFKLSGREAHEQTENLLPYALFGGLSNYTSWTPGTGNYNLSATPYSDKRGKGAKGTAYSIAFSVVNGPTFTQSTTTSAQLKQSLLSDAANNKKEASLSAQPNPFSSLTNVRFFLPRTDVVSLTLYDQKGTEVKRLYQGQAAGGKEYQISLSNNQLPNGVYTLRLTTSVEAVSHKLVLVR